MRPSPIDSYGKAAGQRGFSIIELMIVVVIMGVLASAAVVAMSPDPDVEDEANKIAALVNEGARLAISGGPVDPTRSSTGLQARGRISVRQDPNGQYLLIERLDDQLGFTEIERKRVYLGRRVRVVGMRPSAEINPGTAGFPLPPTGVSINCRPDATCTLGGELEPPTGATLYLQDARRPDRKARVVVLPLNGMMTQMFTGW